MLKYADKKIARIIDHIKMEIIIKVKNRFFQTAVRTIKTIAVIGTAYIKESQVCLIE